MLEHYPMDLPLVSWCASVSSLLGSLGHGVQSDGCTQREFSLFCAPRFVSFVCHLIYKLSTGSIMLHTHAGVMLMQLAFLFDLDSMARLMQVSCQFILIFNVMIYINLY